MTGKDGEILVNRAPVLTLWAAIVAERLGHDADAATTLGRAVAGSSARVKARAIGLEEKHDETPFTKSWRGQAFAVWVSDALEHEADHGEGDHGF